MLESMYKNQLGRPFEGMMSIKCRWIYKETDVDVYIHKRINFSKGVYDKVEKVDNSKIGYFSSDACLYGFF
jgi:hypothetical protein